MKNKWLDYFIGATILFLPLYLVRFSIFQVPTNLLEMLLAIAGGLWFFSPKKSAVYFPFSKIYWLSFWLLFLGLIIGAFLGSHWQSEAGIIKGWFAWPFLFFLILTNTVYSERKVHQLLKLFYVSAAGVGLIGFFYLLAGKLTFDGRLKAFYLSPNHLAMFLAPGIIIGFFELVRLFQEKKNLDLKANADRRQLYFLLPTLLISTLSFYFTFSYASWLAMFFSLLLTLLLSGFLSRRGKIMASAAFSVVLAVFFFLQLPHQKLISLVSVDERSSFSSRLMIWESAWKIGKDHWIWGIGPGNFQEKYLAYQSYFPPYLEWAVPQPHNLYLAFWLQAGILGLLGFLLLSGSWLLEMFFLLRRTKNSPLPAALFSAILYFLIHGIADTPYWKNDLAFLFWFFLALGLFLLRQLQAKKMPVLAIDKK